MEGAIPAPSCCRVKREKQHKGGGVGRATAHFLKGKIMTPNEEYSKEFWAISEARKELNKREERMYIKLRAAQKKCKHLHGEGGMFYSQCTDCGLTDL
jgi:hypothetical protein